MYKACAYAVEKQLDAGFFVVFRENALGVQSLSSAVKASYCIRLTVINPIFPYGSILSIHIPT